MAVPDSRTGPVSHITTCTCMSTPQEYKHSFIGPGCQDSSYFFHIGGCQDSWQQMKRRKKEEKGKTVRDGRTQVAIFSCVTNWPSTTRKLKAEHIVSFFFLLLPYCNMAICPCGRHAFGHTTSRRQQPAIVYIACSVGFSRRDARERTARPPSGRDCPSGPRHRVASRCLPSQSSHTRAASRSELSFFLK